MTRDVAQILSALERAGLLRGLTPTDVVDALWLARLLGDAAKPATLAAGDVPHASKPAAADVLHASEPVSVRPVAELPAQPRAETPPSTWPVNVQTAESVEEEAEGRLFDVPVVAGTEPETRLTIARSLRRSLPLQASEHDEQIDEVATAEQAFVEGLWIPVPRREFRRPLAVTLVLDASASMLPWHGVAEDLARALRSSGAFRDVRVWSLDSGRDALQVSAGLRRNSGSRLTPKALVDATGRRLILLFTDGVGAAWTDGRIIEALDHWARFGPVALVHALPRQMWERTSLGLGRRVNLRSRRPFGKNREFVAEGDPRLDDDPPPDEPQSNDEPPQEDARIPYPVVALEPRSMARFARLLGGIGQDRVPAVAWSHADLMRGRPASSPESAGKRLRELGRLVSPMARKLIGLLAVTSPLTPSVIRLVRRTFVPEATLLHEAEVLLAGILQRVGEMAGDETLLEFVDAEEVRTLLLDNVPASTALDVLELVATEYEGLPGAETVQVALAGSGAREATIRADASQLEKAAARVLMRIGGEFARLVAKPMATASVRSKVDATGASARVLGGDATGTHRIALVVDCGFGGLTASAVSAMRLREAFEYNGFTVHTLRDLVATRSGIQAWLREHTTSLARGDAFVFAFVGHGEKIRDPYYQKSDIGDEPAISDLLLLVTNDVLADLDNREAGITGVDLLDWLDPVVSATDNVTVILDCGHSAGLIWGGPPTDVPASKAFGAALGRVVDQLRARYHRATPRLALGPQPPDPSPGRHLESLIKSGANRIVRVFATTQNETAQEGPGLDGKTPTIGLFSDAVATAFTSPDALTITWEDHLEAIRTSVNSRAGIQCPGIEGPRNRLPFSTISRDPADSAICRPIGSVHELLAGRLHGVEEGDSFRIARAADLSDFIAEGHATAVTFRTSQLVLRTSSHAAQSLAPSTQSGALSSPGDLLRAVPLRRIHPIPVAVDPDPDALAHLNLAYLWRIGIKFIVRDPAADVDTLEIHDDRLVLRTAMGQPIYDGALPHDPVSIHNLLTALTRLAHNRRVVRGLDGLAASPINAELAWGLAGGPAFADPTAVVHIPEGCGIWIRAGALSHPELYVDVFHFRANLEIHHLTAEFDHGQTVNRSAIAELTRGADGNPASWRLPWPAYVPRDQPVREQLLVVFSDYRGALRVRPGGGHEPLVRCLEYLLVPEFHARTLLPGPSFDTSTEIADLVADAATVAGIFHEEALNRGADAELASEEIAKELIGTGIGTYREAVEFARQLDLDIPIVVDPGRVKTTRIFFSNVIEQARETYPLGYLRSLSENELIDELQQMVDESSHIILHSGVFADAAAETNAYGFELECEVGNVTFSVENCRVEISFTADGEQSEDHMYLGTRISGSATLLIDNNGNKDYVDITADVDHSILESDEDESPPDDLDPEATDQDTPDEPDIDEPPDEPDASESDDREPEFGPFPMPARPALRELPMATCSLFPDAEARVATEYWDGTNLNITGVEDLRGTPEDTRLRENRPPGVVILGLFRADSIRWALVRHDPLCLVAMPGPRPGLDWITAEAHGDDGDEEPPDVESPDVDYKPPGAEEEPSNVEPFDVADRPRHEQALTVADALQSSPDIASRDEARTLAERASTGLARLNDSPRKGDGSTEDPPKAPRPESLQPTLRILLVSASPIDHPRLRVDLEFREIIRSVHKSPHDVNIQFEQLVAAQPNDLWLALVDFQPHILHISAHGTRDGSLLFMDSEGQGTAVTKRLFIKRLAAFRGELFLVVLNATHSAELARDIPPLIDLAIGINDLVDDRTAIRFSAAFYEAIGWGRSIDTAFRIADTTLEEYEDEAFRLFLADEQGVRDRLRRPVLGEPKRHGVERREEGTTVPAILFVSASPEMMGRLAVETEAREILRRMRSTTSDATCKFVQIHAARFTDLIDGLAKHRPSIVHISVHSLNDGSLIFEREGGSNSGSESISSQMLLKMFTAMSDMVKCVVLNGCDSAGLAAALSTVIDLAVGWNGLVDDSHGIRVIAAFYESLAQGRSFETACQLANLYKAPDQLEVDLVLFPPSDQDPTGKRKRKLL